MKFEDAITISYHFTERGDTTDVHLLPEESPTVIGMCKECKHYEPDHDMERNKFGDCDYWRHAMATYAPDFGCIQWEKQQ